MAEISRAALVIVRSGRSTRPATSQPSPIEIAAIAASATSDTNASARTSAPCWPGSNTFTAAPPGSAELGARFTSTFSRGPPPPRGVAPEGAARLPVRITGAGNACE